MNTKIPTMDPNWVIRQEDGFTSDLALLYEGADMIAKTNRPPTTTETA